jgi:hypothetical protein
MRMDFNGRKKLPNARLRYTTTGGVNRGFKGRKSTKSSLGGGCITYKPGNVYVGPSLEGGEIECVKVIGGKVAHRKPSYATNG